MPRNLWTTEVGSAMWGMFIPGQWRSNMRACLDSENERLKLDTYPEFERAVAASMASFGNVPLFTTNAGNIFELYLNNLPGSRQYYNCRACKNFLERYGSLVTIDESGNKIPVMWAGHFPEFFQESVNAIRNAIKQSRVTGVFVSKEPIFGTPVTGIWTHLHATNPKCYHNPSHAAHEYIAEKTADRALLISSLNEYSNAIDQAVELLRANALYRSEKVLGIAEWFQNVKNTVGSMNGERCDNIVWGFVALAPPGFCHVKNTVIGSLLDDLTSGLPFNDAKNRFNAKMDPIKYQRPISSPSSGNIDKAEQIVERLGIEKSLARRYASIDELALIWTPYSHLQRPTTGMFSKLRPSGQKVHPYERIAITWTKFERDILPSAISIQCLVPDHGNFISLLTATYPEAPPIIQWDSVSRRNPVSWYVYHTGSNASRWNLPSKKWVDVAGICYQPSMWQPGFDHHGKSTILVLHGAKDVYPQGSALFPEILKSELREIRKTIEAYSNNTKLGLIEHPACGLRIDNRSPATVKVTTATTTIEYFIDRWE